MFGRSFTRAIHVGPRLLFAASIVMLLAGIVNFVTFATGDVYHFATTEYVFQYYIGPAAWLLFGAVLTDRLSAG